MCVFFLRKGDRPQKWIFIKGCNHQDIKYRVGAIVGWGIKGYVYLKDKVLKKGYFEKISWL